MDNCEFEMLIFSWTMLMTIVTCTGKSESIWDFNLHQNPKLVADGTNGDVACDSYHKWQEDINLVKNLGANFYRFSISWPRILPSGSKGSKVNKKGVAYYKKLIDGLLAEGITPLVTIYHWDLPQKLQEQGGWLNETIIEDFVYYADTLFKLYGDRVKQWITFNEPYQICEYGYSDVALAPFMNLPGIGGYKCSHHLLLAHGRTYREYENKYKSTQKGEVGIAVNSGWFEPKEDSDSNREAVERVLQFSYGWYMHPVVLGNYPPIMIERIDSISRAEGFQESRLPKFTEEQIEMIHGSYDYVGLNHYSTALVESNENHKQPSFLYDCGVSPTVNNAWETSPTLPGLQMVPWGFRNLLVWIKNEYGNPPLLITENGWPSHAGLNDEDRIRYVDGYLSEVLKAMHEDGCKVVGYSYWSLLDNFEWLSGFRYCELASTELSSYSFPKNFIFGVATAAYQIEGGVNEDGKTDSIWDFNLHQNPDLVIDKTNGDITCDSFHKWQEDIRLVENLGADFYRFSIAWTRILPSGNKGSDINEKGVEYYNNLINGLLAKGIIPMVTIYHWDLPQELQKNGGWLNESIVDDFVYYAKTLFELYGDRVKHWITFNEPYQVCESAYSGTEDAPFLNMTGVGGYKCSHNLLLAHGRTYREYVKKYKQTQGGDVGVSIDTRWFEPKEDTESDKKAAEQMLQFRYGWHMHPVVIGNYPPIMIQRIDAISTQESFLESRLPKFTDEQIEMIRGSFDFIGLNHYTTSLTTLGDNYEQPSFDYDSGVKRSSDSTWEVSPTASWLSRVPWGLRKLLNWIKKEYGNPSVLISENGWSSNKGLNDFDRIQYITEYLSEVLNAIHDDGCKIIGYAYWSLQDNFEWLDGLTAKFGLVEIDFDSPNRTRTPRQSYRAYQKIISSRKIN